MTFIRLPPKPNIQTGEPRPPHAPLESQNSEPGHRRESAKRKVSQPPNEGPLLEWFYPDRTTRLVAGLCAVSLGVLIYTIKDWGFDWVTNIWLWLILLPWPIFFLATGRRDRTSAGADWLAYGKRFVKTYELTSIEVVIDGAAHSLRIRDKDGRGIHAHLSDLQQNHELWDLVYNGLLHSMHINGAETNKMARDYLQLDFPPQLLH